MSVDGVMAQVRAHRTGALVAFDVGCVLLGYALFSVLRHGPALPTGEQLGRLAAVALVASLLQAVAGLVLRIYQGRAVVGGREETLRLTATVSAVVTVMAVLNASATPPMLARAVPVGAGFASLALMLVGRALWRGVDVGRAHLVADSVPALIFGAGSAGRQLARSMLASADGGLRPIGFLDDDPWKRRLRSDGVAVLGTRNDLTAVAAQTGARVLVIAIPSATPVILREIAAAAREAGLEVKVLPRLGQLLSPAHASIRDVRDINVQDVLGRGSVHTDVQTTAAYLTGKRVLVTGAGGSIGAELCRQIQGFDPAELMMLDRDESGLHGVQLLLHGRGMLDDPGVILADIREEETLRAIFRERRPEVVFHAAALKHLPMLEQYPDEAVKTNVVGTLNVLRAAADAGVENFVNISTDKAANPTSVLGLSKRVAERLTSAMADRASGTFVSVRFGNVLGSRGSVLTSFATQIAAGGPVTVTHPDVTRYFMTVEEAVHLVLAAGALGEPGETLILDMGEPVSIREVAEQLIEQSGQDIRIAYTGLRAGEKLHEELFAQGEPDRRPRHPMVSHVPVEPLDPVYVSAWAAGGGASLGAERLQAWSTQSNAPLAPLPRTSPRTWSSIES